MSTDLPTLEEKTGIRRRDECVDALGTCLRDAPAKALHIDLAMSPHISQALGGTRHYRVCACVCLCLFVCVCLEDFFLFLH